MRRQVIFGFLAILVASVSVTGCYKKSGAALVLEKEHIAAKEITSTPAPQESASASSPTPGSNEAVLYEESTPRELAEDEIVVETYVMKKDARGTSRDPRAISREQWIVWVKMVAGPRIKVHADQAQWDKLKIGDRINVTYREGKYTGTVWAAEIE